MPAALEIINAFATNPGTGPAFAATTLATGDTAAIRNFNSPSRTWLQDVWALTTAAGAVRIRSPRLHDNVQNLRFRTVAATNRILDNVYTRQNLYAQDSLIAELFGGAAETDCMAWMVYYEDLPGISARLADLPTIASRIVNMLTVEVANTSGAAIGAYSASAAINSAFDLLEANTDYALLGYLSDTNGVSVGIRGPDTGNLRLGGPMTTERIETRSLFADMSVNYGVPCIPIINSANKGATFVDNFQNIVGVAANITLNLAQLHP